MKPFLNKDFLLQTGTAQQLYHQYAAGMPIIDYHNHLSPADIANDKRFSTITEIWLKGDHYKWRAMRANGINERLITGAAGDEEKFFAWASTVPYGMRNPLYHWTHLELQRYFDIDILLNETSAKEIYDACNALLQTKEYSVRNLLRKMKVEILCTTDDPCDSLEYHKQLQQEGFDIKVLPAFRPDNIIAVENLNFWQQYFKRLCQVTKKTIKTFDDFINALKIRHDYFARLGCCVSDHGGDVMYAEDYTKTAVNSIFDKLLHGQLLCHSEVAQFKSAVLYELALLDHEKGWVQQWHVGALRNTNSRLLEEIGTDAGVDSIGDFSTSKSMAAFFNRLDSTNQLSKTIVYNLNPADNEVYATMMGNFQDGSMPGKMQYGAAWWFLDQKDGLEKQINALSNMGLLSLFIGMITDSRSFLSFPRHEYFRRILCNLFGTEIENGELPNDMTWIGKMIQDICYHNASNYFNWKQVEEPMHLQNL
jgi:glucuronate isomerase